ncbi:phosphoheptose isomerase [Nonomuraea sp. NPDC004297]
MADLLERALDRAQAARVAPGAALAAEAAEIVRAARAMSERFGRGGRLLASGSAADAAHVAVEFTHPVIVGKRALPAFAVDAVLLRTLGRPGDIAVGIGPDPGDGLLAAARELGMLTVALTAEAPAGARPGERCPAEHVLVARTADPLVAREIHVTVYHLLWELVHVFLESS